MTNNSTEILFCNHPTTNILDMSKETDTPAMKNTDTPRADAWECFSDPSYYDMARLRRTDGPKDFNTGYHLNNLREAIEVRDTLNELERRAEKAESEVAFWKSKAHEAEQSEGKLEAKLAELWSRFDKQMEAESEVERLREQLKRAVEIAEDLSSGDAWKFTAADEKLAALKREIK